MIQSVLSHVCLHISLYPFERTEYYSETAFVQGMNHHLLEDDSLQLIIRILCTGGTEHCSKAWPVVMAL